MGLVRLASSTPVSSCLVVANVPCGSGQDSSSDDWKKYPTNVTRFARALSASTFIPYSPPRKDEHGKEKLEEVEQIVYYQKGVGTGIGDKILGGMQPTRVQPHRTESGKVADGGLGVR